MEAINDLTFLKHVCDICSESDKCWALWNMEEDAKTCLRAHFLFACVQAMQPLFSDLICNICEGHGSLSFNFGDDRGGNFPSCYLWAEFECVIADPTSKSKLYVCNLFLGKLTDCSFSF
jgi:hypothetical protein